MKNRPLSFALLASGVATAFVQGQISFEWTGDTTAHSGDLYYASVAAGFAESVDLFKGGYFLVSGQGEGVSTQTSDTGAQTVEYMATGYYAQGAYSENSPTYYVTITEDTQPPSVPTGLASSQLLPTSFRLSWNASTDNNVVSLYEVERNSSPGGTTSATYKDQPGLADGTSYTMRVRAKDNYGNWSDWSDQLVVTTPDVTAPSQPGNPAASNVTGSTLLLSWSGSTDNVGVTSYEVRSGGAIVATPAGSPATVGGLTQGHTYNFTVVARDAAGNTSGPSASLAVTMTTPFGIIDVAVANTTYASGQNLTVTALNSIAATPNVTVNSGANITFQACGRITLGPGFRASEGSVFKARIPVDTADNDGDGIPNWWESTFGQNPNNAADGLSDADGDGFSNIAEYNLYSDPTSADTGAASIGGSLPPDWPTANPHTLEAVGITAGELSVTPMGAATYSIPLWVTPGTAGMEPKLTLNYSSHGGGGLLGAGWSLGGLSAISRGPQTVAVDGAVRGVDFTYADRFYLDGQRLVDISGAYGYNGTEYRTEIDSFSRVISRNTAGNGPEWFEVWTKAGLIIEFGNTSDSRLMGGSGGSTVRTWAVNKISDTVGNYMSFVYTTGATGEQLLDRIEYTGHSGTPTTSPYASAQFIYENRPDRSFGYVFGTQYHSSKRLKEIQSRYSTTVIRRYVLGYTTRQYTNRSLLTSLTEIGSDGTALPPLSFEYAQPTAGWDSTAGAAYNYGDNQYLLADNDTEKPTGAGLIDFNGDGWTDFIFKHSSGAQTALQNNGNGWTYNSAYLLPHTLASSGGDDQSGRFVDLDGDGLVDFVWALYGPGGTLISSGARLNTGSGWSSASQWTPPAALARGSFPKRSGSFLDINGDGRPDLVTYFTTGGSLAGGLQIFLNNGDGWTYDSNYSSLPGLTFTLSDKKPRFVDLDADGLPDLVVHHRPDDGASSSGSTTAVWRNTGSGWSWNSAMQLPRFIAVEDADSSVGTEFVDVNGDGLPDQIWNRRIGGGIHQRGVAINTGNHAAGTAGGMWNVDDVSNWPDPDDFFDRYVPPYELGDIDQVMGRGAVMDVNGDGIADSAYNPLGSAFSTTRYGNLWKWDFAPTPDANLPTALKVAGEKFTGLDFADLNGDGMPDIMLRRKNANGSITKNVWINQSTVADRLVSVTSGFGVVADIHYRPLTDSSVYARSSDLSGIDSTEHVNVANVAGPMYVVSQVDNDDGAGGAYSMTYQYGGLRSHRTRGSLGFSWMSVLDTRTDILSTTEFQQNFPCIGMPVEAFTVTGSGAGVTLSESSTVYDNKPLNGGKTRFVFAKSSSSTTRDLDNSIVAETSTVTQRGALGQTDDYDDYGNSKYIFTDLDDGYSKTTVNTYGNTVTSTNWFLGRLSRSEVTSIGPDDPSPGLTRTAAFTYNSSGLLETETVEPDAASSGDPAVRCLYAKTTYAYDAFGNKQSVTTQAYTPDSSGSLVLASRTTTVQFDSIGRFVETRTNALNQTESFDHHPSWGAIESHTGPNALTTTFDFDAFGRPAQETRADGTSTRTVRRWAFGHAPTDAVYYVETQAFLGTAPISAPAVEFFDALGRGVRKLGVDGDGYGVAVDTRYDAMGRPHETSTAFRTVHSPVGWTRVLAYDLLNRPIVVITPDDEVTTGSTAILPDGTATGYTVPAGHVATTYKYNGRIARVRNPRGVVTRNTTNGQGWEVGVVQNETNLDFDPDSAEQTTLSKLYDAQGNLVESTAAGATIVNVYDVRGRRMATDDPDMGVWSYKYNGFGELIEQIDARLQKTTNACDALGRPTQRMVYTSSSALEERTDWVYDTASGKGAGKLHHVQTKAANGTVLYTEIFTYDSLGRPGTITRTMPDAAIPNPVPSPTIASTSYTVTFGYDSAGRLETTTYPTGFATRNLYNAFGVLKEVRRSDGGRNDVFWMAMPDPANSASVGVARYILGNGVTTERAASKATGRLRDIDSGIHGGFGLQQIAYDYDVLANVKTRHDAATGLNETAWYDALNRLEGFVSTLGVNVTDVDVDYAANGNIIWKSDVGGYAYAGPRPHAVTSAGGQGYTYDDNGGLLTGGGRSVQWTAFNQIRRIDKGGAFSEFRFGAGRERVGQASNNGNTIYVGGLYEKFTPNSGPVEHWHWIMTPAGRVAVHKTFSSGSPATRYFHHDALGSITVVTDERAGVVERFRYDAWGKRLDSSGQPVLWASNDGITRGFTDHEHLDDLGLVHMNGRIYDPVLARFLSADPFIDGTSDSQGFNRYSYVHNNPLNETDPSGYLSLKDVVKIVAVAVIAYFTAGAALYAASNAGVVVAGSGMGFANIGMAAGAIFSGSLTFTGAVIAGAAGGFASGFAGSLLNGGSVGDAFQAGLLGGLVGGASAGLAYGIGSWAKTGGFEGDWLHHALHGAAQGALTEAAGGEFRHGFFAAAFASAAARPVSRYVPGGTTGQTVAAAVVGGTASALGGGKFANGAVSGAFTYLFNQAQHQSASRNKILPSRGETAVDLNNLNDKIAKYLAEQPGVVIPISREELLTVYVNSAYGIIDAGIDSMTFSEFSVYMRSEADTVFYRVHPQGGGDPLNSASALFQIANEPRPYLGGDINYVFVGAGFAARGWSIERMLGATFIWNVKQAVAGEGIAGNLRQASDSARWATDGHAFWRAFHRDLEK